MMFQLSRARGSFAAASLAALTLLPASADAQPNMEIMMRWNGVKVVHFDVIGDFVKEVFVVNAGTNGLATVKDHVVIGFDYDITEGKLVGMPKFTDSATEMGAIRNGADGCRPPTVSGKYEYSTIESLTQGLAGQLMMTVRTDYPAAQMTVACTGGNQAVAARSVRNEEEFVVPGIALLAMGSVLTGDALRVSNDAKSFIVKKNGWTYIYTPRKVR